MKFRRVLHSVLAALLLSVTGSAQQNGPSVGVGANFGMVTPNTDIDDYNDNPFGRAFLRFYPVEAVGIEAGVGMGRLQAGTNGTFFTTLIYPFDLRLMFQPLKESKIQPFAFGGLGLIFFDPKDELDNNLPRNNLGQYSKSASFVPIGIGGEYYLEDNFAFGLTATYSMAMTDNLDDIEAEGNDSFWGVGIQVFGFLTETNNDLDGDGLLNDEERRIGTDPLNPDTDGDDLKDGEEVKTYKTDPLNPDTDGDKLNDGDEVFRYKTDPLDPDTDNDGLEDGYEVETIYRADGGLRMMFWGGLRGLNSSDIIRLTSAGAASHAEEPVMYASVSPTLSGMRPPASYQTPQRQTTDPLSPDTDNDGLLDGEEVLTFRTHPLKVDTDGDGLTDSDEVRNRKTDPLKPDTDGDGLSDGDEINRYRTNPLAADTDGGGVPDGREIQMELNPLDPADDVPIISVGERIVLEGVNFETDKATLLPGAMSILDQVASSLNANPDAEVAIHGHTDNVGGARYNQELSLRRAESVKEYLVGKGVASGRMSTRGYGFTKPIADNGTAAGRAKNRRIEFIRIK